MKAVWLVRARELAGRMRFWITIVGFDPRERSFSQSIYLIYVAIFFSLWGFAVLALLANLGAGMLSLVNGATPSETSTMIVAIVLFGDAIIQGYKAGRRSPFIFSETDAELICQTPLDRRQIALAWFLGDWLPDGLVFGALAVVLRFANLQLVEPGGVVWAHLPSYLLAGLQVASIVLPLHIALMAIDYALGAWRLRGDRDNSWLRWIPVGAGVVLIILAIVNTRGMQIILWPLLFPLRGGFGEAYWLVGFTLAVLLVMVGLLILYLACPRLNLSRAAQESRFRWAVQQISWLGDSRLRGDMITRQKLGVSHQSSRIQGRAGVWALIWKDWVATARTMNFGTVMTWLSIFVVFMGVLLVPDWGARVWAFIIWSLLVGQRCTERLRADLGVWTITRQLPFSWRKTLVAELATPVVGATLVSWLAMGVSTWLGFIPQISLILLAPAAILCITLTAAFDILRNCRSSELLVGQVADLGAGGLISGIILAAIPMVMFSWSASQFSAQGINWLITLLAISLSIGIVYGMWRLAAAAFKNIK